MKLYLLLFIFFLLEGTITTIPLVLISLLLYFTFTRCNRVFLLAFVLGILIDVLRIRPIGLSSMYYLLFLFLVSLYEKKFEITSISFIIFSSLIGSLGYLALFSKI